MILEYYMYEAERCDNDKIIQGYYLQRRGQSFIIDGFVQLEDIEVKPETVRRVAVKPIKDFGWICPNCKGHWVGDMELHLINHCQDCGMALDWSDF